MMDHDVAGPFQSYNDIVDYLNDLDTVPPKVKLFFAKTCFTDRQQVDGNHAFKVVTDIIENGIEFDQDQ